jgi:hypothetical protein
VKKARRARAIRVILGWCAATTNLTTQSAFFVTQSIYTQLVGSDGFFVE